MPMRKNNKKIRTPRDCRDIIMAAAKHWIRMTPGGYLFRAYNVQEYVWGTEILACKERGETRSGKPRFHADVAAAIPCLAVC
jgi:hypothetical protein